MRAQIRETRIDEEKKISIKRKGEVSTRPRYEFEQEITLEKGNTPVFDVTYPVPLLFIWDNTHDTEAITTLAARTELSRKVAGVDVIDVNAREWARRGHIWREIKINDIKVTQEVWYREEWRGHELYKDLWIQWNRKNNEEVHIVESDGLRIRYFFRKAKELVGEPPGYFWYRNASYKLSSAGMLFRLALRPEIIKYTGQGWGQDLGYRKWPSDFWIKFWYDGKHLWTIKEKIEADHIAREIMVEPKRLKIF